MAKHDGGMHGGRVEGEYKTSAPMTGERVAPAT